MPDEQNYKSHLLPIEEALKLVSGGERKILQYAWEIYCFTLTELEKQRLESEQNEIGDILIHVCVVVIHLTFPIFKSRSL